MNITQVPLQVHSGDKVLTALEAGKCYVPMLLLDVNFQGEPLGGLELAVVTVDEEAHVLCLDVAVQSTFPPALEATELAGELHLKKKLTECFSSKTLHLFVNCTLMAQEMRLLSGFVIAETTLEPHIFISPIQVFHPGHEWFEMSISTTKKETQSNSKHLKHTII